MADGNAPLTVKGSTIYSDKGIGIATEADGELTLLDTLVSGAKFGIGFDRDNYGNKLHSSKMSAHLTNATVMSRTPNEYSISIGPDSSRFDTLTIDGASIIGAERFGDVGGWHLGKKRLYN